MIYALCFIAGLIFMAFLYPFLVNLANLFAGWVETKTSLWSLYIQKAAIDMDLVEKDEPEINTQVIGFQQPEQHYCDCDDE